MCVQTQQHVAAGLKWGEDNLYGCPLCRTCRFDNVCLNHSSLDIQYYKGNSPLPLFYDASTGRPHHQFPTDFLNTGAQRPLSCNAIDWVLDPLIHKVHKSCCMCTWVINSVS